MCGPTKTQQPQSSNALNDLAELPHRRCEYLTFLVQGVVKTPFPRLLGLLALDFSEFLGGRNQQELVSFLPLPISVLRFSNLPLVPLCFIPL